MAKRPELSNDIADKLITFIYYRDLQKGIDFYENVLGFKMEIDQGWTKIYRVAESAYVGIVDETKGFHKWNKIKPVQICIRVPSVDEWYDYLKEVGVDNLSEMFAPEDLGIRAFVFTDPEGYQVEIQEAVI